LTHLQSCHFKQRKGKYNARVMVYISLNKTSLNDLEGRPQPRSVTEITSSSQFTWSSKRSFCSRILYKSMVRV